MYRGSAISCSSMGSNTTLRQFGPQPLMGPSAPVTKATGSQRLWYMRCLSVCASDSACYSVSKKRGLMGSLFQEREEEWFSLWWQICFRMVLRFMRKHSLPLSHCCGLQYFCYPRERMFLWDPCLPHKPNDSVKGFMSGSSSSWGEL